MGDSAYWLKQFLIRMTLLLGNYMLIGAFLFFIIQISVFGFYLFYISFYFLFYSILGGRGALHRAACV